MTDLAIFAAGFLLGGFLGIAVMAVLGRGRRGMSVVKFTAHEGKGNVLDRSMQITEAIKRACYENGEGLALAFVLGCLEIAKVEIMEEQKQ